MEEIHNDRTVKYDLPIRKLLIKIEDLIDRNRERISALEQLSASKKIIETFRKMQEELLACLEIAVKEPEKAEQMVDEIKRKYKEIVIF